MGTIIAAVLVAWVLLPISGLPLAAMDIQYGTVVVTVQDQTGAPVPYADIVTMIGEAVYADGTVEHTQADVHGQRTFRYPANIGPTAICADYQYLHGACSPAFVIAPGETRSFTIVLPVTLSSIATPTPQPSSGAPGPSPGPSPAASSSPPPAPPAVVPAPSRCQFVLGFRALHDLVPQVVGACLDDEAHAANGDGLQHTTKGLLVWRKADNFTAFTDGYHTWVNCPNGGRERLNSQRFSWEANPDGLPVVP